METRELRRDARDLDEAFYAASCFAGGAHRRTCVIYWMRKGDDELYFVEDAGVPMPEGWEPAYEVMRAHD